MNNRKGFSLIELIVIIAIMSILTGVLTPLFIRYVNDRRERACRQNREAILNEYAKHVYSGDFEVEQSELALFLTASDENKTSSDTLQQIKRYMDCPSANGNTHYVGYVDGTTAYIVCEDHQEDVCVLDFVGWSGEGNEAMADNAYKIPDPVVDTPSGQPPVTSSGEETPPPNNSLKSVWPYKQDENGVEDIRWTMARDDDGNYTNGLSNKAGVWLKLPKYAHFIDDLSDGAEYVIVQGNRQSKFQGSDAIFIKYSYAYGPDTVDNGGNSNDLTDLVKTSGRHYDNKNATPPGSGNNAFNLKKGDMYTFYFEVNGVEMSNTFIASGSVTVNINNGGEWFKQTGIGNSDGLTAEEWKYKNLNSGKLNYVPPLATSVDIEDF